MVYLYGFNWQMYSQRIMPAFASWLINNDESPILQFYTQTRCAREERMMPPVMKQLQSWTRAQAFMKQVPRGPYAYREYRKLCSAEQFTVLSDRYVYHHPPQLYQDSDALRAIWGAIIEEYCIAWLSIASDEKHATRGMTSSFSPAATNLAILRGELVELLHTAGLRELAEEIQQPELPVRETEERPAEKEEDKPVSLAELLTESTEDEEEELPGAGSSREAAPAGIDIGQHPSTLRMRGWLATISVRAMALFELLACGRRAMPFGYRAHEPFESYIGYLTPDETWQMALCLRNIQPPASREAEEDYMRFRQERATHIESCRMIDEVLPEYVEILIKVVRAAASQGLGLLCGVE